MVFSAAIILPLPINVMLTAIGAFSNQGYFSVWYVWFVAVLANVIGDICVYLALKRYGHEILREKYIKKYSFFIKLEHYVANHTGMTIFVSRFVGVLGPPVNFLAGFMKIKMNTFAFFDFLGNALEIGILLFLGYVIGDSWGDISGLVSIAEGLILVSVIIYVLVQLFKKSTIK